MSQNVFFHLGLANAFYNISVLDRTSFNTDANYDYKYSTWSLVAVTSGYSLKVFTLKICDAGPGKVRLNSLHSRLSLLDSGTLKIILVR